MSNCRCLLADVDSHRLKPEGCRGAEIKNSSPNKHGRVPLAGIAQHQHYSASMLRATSLSESTRDLLVSPMTKTGVKDVLFSIQHLAALPTHGSSIPPAMGWAWASQGVQAVTAVWDENDQTGTQTA